jgi:glycosyltransferase involved in cell wall biosynthesis
VLWVGTVEPRKNLPTLLEAFRRLPDDVTLVLAGPEGWQEDLADHRAGLEERIRTPGFVDAGDLAALYAGADVFCYPSLLEGFGMPVLEAMAQGAPVVTSAGTATAEVAGDAGLLVEPTDPEALAAALGAVLDDEALAARLRSAGLARAATYTWERTARLTVAAYREVVA